MSLLLYTHRRSAGLTEKGDTMLTNKSILKLCKRATKKNPKSVHIFDMGNTKARYIETSEWLEICNLVESRKLI